MANDVTVRFGGDTSALQTAIAAAKTTMAGFAASVSATNTAVKAADSAGSGFLTTLRDVAVTLAAITYVAKPAFSALDDLGNSMARAEGSAALLGLELVKMQVSSSLAGIAGAQRGVIDFAESFSIAQAAGARFSVANTGVMASISNGYRAVDSAIQGTIASVQAWYRGIGIYNSGLIEVEKNAGFAAMGVRNFYDAAQSGDLGNLDETLRALTGELTKIPDISDESAKSIQNMLEAIPNYSVATNQALVTLIQQISKTGDEAVANAKKITAAFNDDSTGGATLGSMVAQAKTMQDIQSISARIVGSFKDSGQAVQFLTTAVNAAREANQKTTSSLIEQLQTMEKFGPLARLFEIGINGQIQAQLRVNDELERTFALMQKNLDVQTRIAAADEKQKTLLSNIDGANTVSNRVNDTEDRIKSLSANPRKATDDAEISAAEKDAAIRLAILEAANQTDQGLLGVLNVMKNRLNAGYGNYGDDLGKVISKPSAFSAYDPAKMAAIDPNSADYKRAAGLFDKTFGDDPADDPSKGATHYYNPKLAAPDWGSGMANKTTIDDQVFGNPDGPPVLSGQEDQQRVEALQKANDELRKLNAEKAGGSAIDKDALATAQKTLADGEDQVAAAKSKVAFLEQAAKAEKDPAAAGSPEEQTKADAALANARIELRQKETAAEVAAMKLRNVNYQEGTRERLNADLALFSAQEQGLAKSDAKYIDLERQKAEAVKKFNDAQKADAASTEDAKFEVLKTRSAEAIQTIHEQATVGQITRAEETAQVKAALAQQAQAARDHYATLTSIWGVGTEQHRKAVQQQTQDAEKENQAQLTAANKAVTQMYDNYKQTFEKIGSTVSSSLTSIIEGAGTWRQLMQNVNKQLLSDFVSMGVKWVADWAGRQAASVALSVTGETSKTTAATAGEAARTSVAAAGGLAQAASTLATIGKSITASAAEAFAGIFGFLAPVLGPAAAGPAAAGEATVLGAKAIAGFAVGSWALPGDMVANVHAGEMIVPAAQTPWMQSLAANAAGAGRGGSGGGMTNHFNISANDAQSFVAMFKNNGNALAKIVTDAMNLNPSLRPKF